MDNVISILNNLETVELQILGSLFKIKSKHAEEGVNDLEVTARKLKGSVKSLQCKIRKASQEMEVMKTENKNLILLKEENSSLKRKLAEYELREQKHKENFNTMEESLSECQCVIASFDHSNSESATGSATGGHINDNKTEDASQELFQPSQSKKSKSNKNKSSE